MFGRGQRVPQETLGVVPDQRLRLNPKRDHKPETYENLNLEVSPSIFSYLENHLPPHMLGSSRDEKTKFWKEILSNYLPRGDPTRDQRQTAYKQKILLNYQPKHMELFTLNPALCCVPSFINAISESKEKSFRSIMSEPSPGVFVFDMFQPDFCDLMLSEVENFKTWAAEWNFQIKRPSRMKAHGAVLDDFGMETMLDKLVEGFIHPISKLFFAEVGGATLDSHHGFIVEYGKDDNLCFHVDDSEVTLNVCLGKQFSGGELYFRGARCDDHVNLQSHPEEDFDYCHVPGRAVLHFGRLRHGVRPIRSGRRMNMLIWCRSSLFREMKTHLSDCSSWCGECHREMREKQRLSLPVSSS